MVQQEFTDLEWLKTEILYLRTQLSNCLNNMNAVLSLYEQNQKHLNNVLTENEALNNIIKLLKEQND